MTYFRITDDQAARFEADGYLMVPGLLNADETKLLYSIAKTDHDLKSQARLRHDAQGGVASITVVNELTEDIYSAIARSKRVVDTMEVLLGGEVYHYHHKMTMKEPFAGGAWEWHQDYGYWYNNGCLYPYMASLMIAVDHSTKENGCLQVIRGSHRLGRIEHGKVGDQTGADVDRVNEILKRLELLYCEMEPGDGLFFHSNTLHRSDANKSPNPRWTFLCCYNAARNDPYKAHGHPNYNFLEKWDDSKVMEVGTAQFAKMQAEN